MHLPQTLYLGFRLAARYGQCMTGLAPVLRDATIALETVSMTPRLDAELLLAHALGMDRSTMLLRQHDLILPDNFAALLERRIADEPVAYIAGTQAFWNLELHVTPDVLIPRADSETLIEAAVDWFAPNSQPARIADLGTGSGALLLAALSAFPNSEGIGIDASPSALVVASNNAARLGFTERAQFALLDWTQTGWDEELGRFDLVLCNPPYIEEGMLLAQMVAAHEPHSALFAGADGLADYRKLLPKLAKLLRPKGVAFFEIGYNQAESVGCLAKESGFLTELRHDLAGNPRVLRFSLGIEDYND